MDSQTSMVEAYKSRLVELENKDARKEVQLVEQQRLLQEAQERHSAELGAVESKYQALVEVNLLLEGTILELHGKLETATYSSGTVGVNVEFPKERSPPLSGSLPSSSEGSHGSGLTFLHSSPGIIMSDCCDPAGEIPNLQAIVEPAPSQPTTPSRSGLRRQVTKQD